MTKRTARRGRRARRQTGFALVEQLVALLIGCAVLGVLLQLAVTAQGAARAHADSNDLQQRLRVAIDAIRGDLMMAGAGPMDGSWRGGLIGVLPPVIPARTGSRAADGELAASVDRLSILYVPEPSAHTAMLVGMGGPGSPLVVDPAAPGCEPGDSCGFSRGDRALVVEGVDSPAPYDIFTVAAASAERLTPEAPLSRGYGAGSRVMRIVQRVYYLDRPRNRLMRYDGDSSDLPLVEHVVDIRVTYYADPSATSVPPQESGGSNCLYAAGPPRIPLLADLGGTVLKPLTLAQMSDGPVCGAPPHRFDGDLLRVRRIRVVVRLETEGAEFRGSGPRFMQAGTSPGGAMDVPDQEAVVDVAPRNLSLFR